MSVRYTSQQALYFAPVLGFSHQSPVTTTATASWGLGSNNPVPIVLSSLLGTGACPVPPSGTPTIGQTCSFWYDNDRLGGGNFAFLSLDPAGWDVASGAQCNQSGGANTLTDWISGARPASVSLNWTDPTYVCSDSGIKGVGSGSQVWSALKALQGSTRDFPINWEGPGSPIAGAPSQGTIYANNTIDKYDIIGFAALTIVDVINPQQAGGQAAQDATCSGKPNADVAPGFYDWVALGTLLCSPNKVPPSVPVDAISAVNVPGGIEPDDLGHHAEHSPAEEHASEFHLALRRDLRAVRTAAPEQQQCEVRHHQLAGVHAYRRLSGVDRQHQGGAALRPRVRNLPGPVALRIRTASRTPCRSGW